MPAEQATGRPLAANTGWTCSALPSATTRSYLASSTPSEQAGVTVGGAVVGPGAGDNAAVALGVGAGPGDAIISIGTSGVVAAVADVPIAELSGEVITLADATGRAFG
jgi:sugar (pentulose or hexulose) kinase